MSQASSTESVLEEAAPKRRYWRLLALAAVLGGIFAAGKLTGVTDDIDVASLQATVRGAGSLGALLFMVVFAVGVLAQVPGTLFVVAGVLAYGKLLGFFVNLVGAFLAVCATFLMVRAIGGQPLGEIKRPFLRRMLARLDQKPLLWVFVLRTLAFISPPLNYTLALTGVRFRHYAVGSGLGLIIPMAVVTLLLDWLIQTPWVARLLFG